MKALLIVIGLFATGCAASAQARGPIALNADTFLIEGRPVKLVGINGTNGSFCSRHPRNYGCNDEGRRALSRLLRAGPIRCVPSRLGDGTSQCWSRHGDLSAAQVRSGNAVVTDRTGQYDYSAAMRDATQAEIGLWKQQPAFKGDLKDDFRRNPPITYSLKPHSAPAPKVAPASFDIALTIRENGRVVGKPRLRVVAGQRASVTVGAAGGVSYTLALLPVEERAVRGPGLRLETQLTVHRGDRTVRVPIDHFYLALGRAEQEDAWSGDADALLQIEVMARRAATQR